jgi:thymidylate synthase
VPQKKPNLKQGIKPTYLGVGNGEGKTSNPLGKTWEGMMARCYDKNSTSYSNYGGRGVSVCDSWLQFKSFADDVILLPGWDDKISSEQRWVLDKDRRGDGFLYSPATCMWVTDETNTEISEKFRYTVRKDGIDYDFTNISKFCNDNGIDAKNFSDLWTGNKNAKERYGFQFVNKVLLKSGIDQLQNMIDTIKTNPDSRRNIVMAWNPSTLHHQALPPCHLMFQVNVDDEFLDLHMYQRSADLFLGIPFNIASYGLLLMMLAHVTGKIPRMLYTSYGDLHLYVNHLDQAKEQITRKPFPLPHVALNPKVKNIDDFTFDDIKLIGYEAHPSIKAEISV